MNPTVKEDISYLAALILRLDHPIPELTTKESLEFTKALILVTSGISQPSFNISHILQQEPVLNDFIENFKVLYPQYFDNVHPVFQQMIATITKENHVR
jgi:hypothetical protein